MKVRLLAPEQFKKVPADVRRSLTQMGCEIPQNEASAQHLNNLVSGEFAAKRQTDWAALCAKGGQMRAVVIFGGQNKCSPEPSARTYPITNVWDQDRDAPPFATYLQRASQRRILDLRSYFGDTHQNQPTHDGVEFGGGNASVIYYCNAGKWLELQGED